MTDPNQPGLPGREPGEPRPVPPPGWPAPSVVTPAFPYDGAPTTYTEALDEGRALVWPRWGLKDVVVAILVALVLPTIVLGTMLALGVPRTGGTLLLASLTLPWIGFGLYPWWAARVQGNGAKLDLGLSFRATDLGWGVAGGFAALVLGGLVAKATEWVVGPFDSAAGSALDDADASKLVIWLFALCAAVGAPFFEELCFRGLAYAAIAKWAWGRRLRAVPWATIGSAALFAGIHLEPVRFPLLLTIGLVLSFLRARTGRVGASIVAHSFNNLWAVVGLLLAT